MVAFELNEQGSKFPDKTVNDVNQIFNRPDDWLGFEDVRLAEGYIKGDLRLVFRASIAEKEWLVYFQRFAEIGCSKLGATLSEIVMPVSCVEKQFDFADTTESSDQSVVLIGNVQFVEYPEMMSLPVLVRFGTPDFILSGIRHSLYLSSK
jgi:hypothetical protein